MEIKEMGKVTVYPDGRMDRANTANYIGVKAKTLAAWACKGIGPRFIRRGKIFYFKDEVDSWLKCGNQRV